MLESPPPSQFQTLLSDIKTISEILGLAIGGLWAYYKFFKGRTFRPRLELEVSGSAWRSEAVTQLKASLQIKNVGLSKLGLSPEGTALRVFTSVPAIPGRPASLVDWHRLITISVFTKHRWIEPGETITEQTLFSIDGTGEKDFKLELRIVADHIEWNSLAIIELDAKHKRAG